MLQEGVARRRLAADHDGQDRLGRRNLATKLNRRRWVGTFVTVAGEEVRPTPRRRTAAGLLRPGRSTYVKTNYEPSATPAAAPHPEPITDAQAEQEQHAEDAPPLNPVG